MAKQETAVVATMASSENAPVTLSMTTADIRAMELSSSGGLVISKADGSVITIENFKALAEQGAKLTLQDGETIDAAKLFETLAADLPAATAAVSMVSIAVPESGHQAEVTLRAGEKYVFAFDPATKDMHIENGDLVITFENGAVIVIHGYEQAAQLDNPPSMQLAGGQVIDAIHVLNLARMPDRESDMQADIRKSDGADDMAALAEKLAEVQPAAGGEGGGGAASRGGFGFGSEVDPAPLGGIPPIGPIGPTALQFGTPEFTDTPFLEEEIVPPGAPTLEAEGVKVYEDGSVLLSIAVSSNGASGVNTVGTISGFPAGWTVDPGLGTYNAATGTWTIILTGGGSFVGGPTIYPPHDSDLDLSGLVITVTNTDTTTGLSTSLSDHVDVLVDAVADKPNLVAHDASGPEDTTLPVSITTAVTDVDGSESITKVTVGGVPAGFILSAGTNLGGGVYELTPAQIAGLTMTPPAHFSGSLTLTVTTYNAETTTSGSEFDLTNNTNSTIDDLNLTWSPAADVPDLQVQDVIVKEDHSITLPISANLVDSDGSEFLTVTVTGIPSGWAVDNNGGTYNAGTGTWTITLAPGLDFNGGPTLHPSHDSDVDSPALTVTATATEIGNGDTASNSGTAFVIVDAVADIPTVNATDNVGAENTALAVNIAGALIDLDGSETVVKYQVSGVPSGFSFNHGTDLGGGVWEFTPAQLAGLKAASPVDFVGTISLNATVFTAETNLSGTEPDVADNTATATDPFTLQWKPTANPPTVEANLGVDDAIVKEDRSIFVPIKATLDPDGSGNEILTVTVTGINPAWVITNTDGSYNPVTGTWTITLAPGQNYNGGLTFAPPHNSDLDMTGLNAHATAFEPATGTSASADDAFRVITDAVADAPNLTASTLGAEENHPVALNIVTSANDLDGSEAITKIVISGVPAGASLNHGVDLGGGAWQLTTAQLAGLNLNPPTGFSGIIHLNITTTVQEINLGGLEVDLLDNTATKTVALDVNVTKDDVPVLLPETITVDETNLAATGTVTINDSVQANFFTDAPGTFGTTGTFSSSIPLTSNGVPVTVTLVGSTYTGSAGGDQIFTLHLNSNGTYNFNLTGVLDHPDPTNTNENIALNFGVSATDSDSDTVTGTIKVNVRDDAPKANNDVNTFDRIDGSTDGNVISGLNGGPGAADLGSQDVPNKVTAISFGSTTVAVPSTGTATIDGDHGTLTIKSDGSYVYTVSSIPPAPHDYNIAMMLDVSGSMGSKTDPNSRISLLVNAVKNLIGDFHDYTGGMVQVHLVPFSTTASAGATFNVSSDAGFADVLSYLNGLTGNGYTNYEAPLQSASSWLASQSGSGATTISYFISDGQPNRYLDADGNPVTGDVTTIFADLNGSDGSNDIETIQSLSDEVIGVGINIGSSITRIDSIDSDGHAINVVDPQDLDAALSSTNPIPTSTTDQFVYQLTDADGDPVTATLTLTAESPVVLPPTLVVNNGVDDAIVKEDHSIFVPIVAILDPNGPTTQVLTVTVTGIQSSWHITNTDGVYNAATGTWSITLAPGQNYSGGLTFAPPANKDIDMSGLNASAKATEPVTGLTSTVNDGFRVITDAVADAPNLTATSLGGEQDHPIALNIATSVNDTDGSESITKIVISGVPTAGSLSAGTNLGGGVWQLTTAQLAGLKLNPPAGFSGTVNLSVTSTAKEVTLSGVENDLTDNTATKTVTLGVHVERDDVPVIVDPAAKVVDETNLSSGAITASGTVAVNYGTDIPGKVEATGGFTSSVPLTSNGIPVAITASSAIPAIYTGKAGGETIFTFTINANGNYVFKLIGTLDHPVTTNHNDMIQLGFAVRATDSDGDTANSVVLVNVLDDGPCATADSVVLDTTAASISGNVTTNDVFSQDTPNKVSSVSFGSTSVNVPQTGTVTIEGSQGTLKLAADGSYTYTLKPASAGGVDPTVVNEKFTYTLKDSDGDSDTANLTINLLRPLFVVGTNVHDLSKSTTPYEVGPGFGTITGGAGSDVLVGDTGGATQENQPQDYNIVMMLDVSGSMGSKTDPNSRISLLASAVKNLMADFHDYTNGDIKVHLVPFSTTSNTTATFTVTEDTGYANVLTFLNGLNGNGFTNYEAPMQSAINWLQGAQPINNATTISYFVSDGEPNRYLNGSGQPTTGSVAQVLAQLNGTADGTNEIATLKSLSDEVIGVGINIGSNISNINVIDSNGVSINVVDPQDLDAALAASNPLNRLSSVGSDHLVGGAGNDLIYGDSMDTDTIAMAMGLGTPTGSGWDVFARLESGQSTVDPTWNRADTLDYIRSHSEALGGESLGTGAISRTGGNDTINGGAGNDVIFGQEGHDKIIGGAGNDLIYGGSGEDTFLFNVVTDGVDSIKDFDVNEGDVLDLSVLLGSVGFDAVNDAITNFVFATDTAQGTVIKLDATGSGNSAAATSIVLLDGIHGVDLNTLIANGALTTV